MSLDRSIYSNRTVSWVDLPTVLIEYVDLVLQNKADTQKSVDFSFFGMVQASYTTCTRMISQLLTLVLGFALYSCNNYDIILVPWYNYNINGWNCMCKINILKQNSQWDNCSHIDCSIRVYCTSYQWVSTKVLILVFLIMVQVC